MKIGFKDSIEHSDLKEWMRNTEVLYVSTYAHSKTVPHKLKFYVGLTGRYRVVLGDRELFAGNSSYGAIKAFNDTLTGVIK